MSANVWPVDAVAGAPSYTGRVLRQLVGLSWARNPSRPLGAVTGVVAGTPTTIATATSTTWTVTPFGGVIDGETSAVAGGYNYSFDAAVTGAVTAANASNPRIDLLYVRISDPAEGDGSSVPVVELLYLAGTAASTPAAPATPARSMALATILVPKATMGSPSVSWVAPFTVAAGGIAPNGSYPPVPYIGQYVDDPTGKLQRYNGSAWTSPVDVGHIVTPAFLSAAFAVGTGGASGGSIAIPALTTSAMLYVKLTVTPPASSTATTLLSWTGDSRLTGFFSQVRTPITSATTNPHDYVYIIPVSAGAAGTTTFTVAPNFNGCTARVFAGVFGMAPGAA